MRPSLETLESLQLLSGAGDFQFQFGTPKSPLHPGDIRIARTVYTASRGYGWLGGGGIKVMDRGRSADPQTRQFNYGRDKTFRLDLPDGVYDVTPTLGDAKAGLSNVSVWINGILEASGLTTRPGHDVQRTIRVKIDNGQLLLRIASLTRRPYFAIDSLVVRPSAPPQLTVGPNLSAIAGLPVTFGASVAAAEPLTYRWEFGDGTAANGFLTPSHTYANPGTYIASLTVTDANGLSNQGSLVATVNDVAPTVSIGGPYQEHAQASVSFAASATEPNPTEQFSLGYRWNFGDGATATGASPSHVFAQDGIYNVTLTVTNVNGLSSQATTVVDIFPSVTAGLYPAVNEGQTVNFAGTAVGNSNLTFHWNFGDGTTADGTLTPSHVYYNQGTYTATLTATDPTYHLSSSNSVAMIVNDVAPSVQIGGTGQGTQGVGLPFTSTVSVVSPQDQAGGFSYLWSFGDGTTDTTANPTHTYNQAGNFTVTLTVSVVDGASGTATTTAQIAQSNSISIDQNWLQQRGSGPYYLDQAGATYVLNTDVSVNGTAFIVLNRNITLDLNGHTVTYGNSQPITVPNGGFEDGATPTDIPHWNVLQAPGAVRTTALTGMWGSSMLQLPNVTAIETILSDPISIPTANVEYAASITPMASSGTTITISVVDTVTGAVLASGSSASSNRGFSAVAQFTPTTTDPVRLKVDATPAPGMTATVDLDYASLTRSRDFGIVATKAYYYLPSFLQTPTVVNNARNVAAFTLKNGSVIQGQGASFQGSPIFAQSLAGLVVDTATLKNTGMDSVSISGQYASNVTVTNSQLIGGIDRLSDRMLLFGAIQLQRSNGTIDIENNTISGPMQSGIVLSGASFTAVNYTSIKILGNNIAEDSSWTDGYGICMEFGTNNFEIANNTIKPVSGRGIILDGSGGQGSIMQNGTIHDNYVESRERPNLEFGWSGLEATALRIRNYSITMKNIDITNNTFVGYTDVGMTWATFAGRVSLSNYNGQMNNSNFVIENNTFKAIVLNVDPSYTSPRTSHAYAFSLSGVDTGTGLIVQNNTFASNCVSLNLGDSDSYGLLNTDVTFINNTIAKSTDGAAMSYTGIAVGDWNNIVSNIRLIDMQYAGGATSMPTFLGNKSKDVEFGYLLNVSVLDANGNPVIGASVSLVDQQNNLELAGITDANGQIQGIAVLTEEYSVAAGGDDGNPTYTVNNPYTIKATSGTKLGSQTVSLIGDMSANIVIS